MLECSWFLIYLTLPSSTVSSRILEPTTRFNKVNIDLKTYVNIDEEDKDADLKLLINNQKLKGDVKFIIGNDHDLRREFTRDKNKRFTEFIQNVVVTLQKFNDRYLSHFWSIFDEEIRKYHYQNCKFFELTRNPALNKLIAHKLESMKDDSAATIRSNLAAISKNIEIHNGDDETKKRLMNLINALYTNDDLPKFKRFLLNIETFNIYNGKLSSLRQIIQEGIRSIIFDHYSELHNAARQEIKYRIEQYFQNILKPKTSVLAEITNSMFLDFHVSGEKTTRKITTKSERGILRTKKHENKHNHLQSRFTKKKNTKKRKRKMKKINTDSTEQTIIKSEIQFDEMFAQTKTPIFFNPHVTNSKHKENEKKVARNLKDKKNIEEKEPTHPKLITERRKIGQTLLRYLTESTTKKILPTRTFLNEQGKTTFMKNKKPSKFGNIKIITMRPYSPKRTTFFGNMHYLIEIGKNMEVSRGLSALRAKGVNPQTKIPGILFGTSYLKKRVVDDIKKVTAEPIQEKTTSGKLHFRIPKTSTVKNKNTEIEDESAVGFYKRRAMNLGNESFVTELTPVTTMRNILNNFGKNIDLGNAYYDKRSKKETKPVMRNADYLTQTTPLRESRNLRINVDDYIKGKEIKEKAKNTAERKPIYEEKIHKDGHFNYDNFIRGKIGSETKFGKFKTTKTVSNTVEMSITNTNFIRIEKDTNNIKNINNKHQLKSVDDEDISIGGKLINNEKTQMNSSNPVVYQREVESMASKLGHSKEIKSKFEVVNYRKGTSQESHNNYKKSINDKHIARKETNEMYRLETSIDNTDNVIKHHLPPKDLRQSLPEQIGEENVRLFNLDDHENKTVEVNKNFNDKRIDVEKYRVEDLNSQVKHVNRKGELLNSRFIIESRKNNTRLSNFNTTGIVDNNKIFIYQDATTRKSKWNKIKNYVFKRHTAYGNVYSSNNEESNNKQLDIDSDKTKKILPENFDISQRSVNKDVKEIDIPLIAANTNKKVYTTPAIDKILKPSLSSITPEPFITSTQKGNKIDQAEFGTVKIFNPSKEVTNSELEKLEPIARKKDVESIKRVLSERKAQRQVKLDPFATMAGKFGARRLMPPNIDSFDEDQIETVRQIKSTGHIYQHVPKPKDDSIYLYMEKN